MQIYLKLMKLSTIFSCRKELGLDREKVNVNGSGVGLGHPIGCTGARITVSLIHELKRRLEKGIASLCVGGIGVALFIEAL